MKYTPEKQILQDLKRNGKPRNWRGKKIGAWHLYRSYQRLGKLSKASRTMQCASFLDFKVSEDGEKKLYRANFCKDKFCPVCASRRSEKLFGQVNKIIDYIEQQESHFRYIFLTLTVRNVPGEELSGTLDKLFAGFNALTKRKEFKALSHGWIRCLEVTHNWKEKSYHPHLHMAIAVSEKYFDEYENYLNHDAWMGLWRACMSLDYDPWVYVEKVRKDAEAKEKGTVSYRRTVSEVTKYTTKSNDYIVKWKDRERFEKNTGIHLENAKQCEQMTDEVVNTLDNALFHRRLVAFGGILRKVHKMLNLDDVEDGDLINTDNGDDSEMAVFDIVRYKWDSEIKDYVLDLKFLEKLTVGKNRDIFVQRGP
jgi:plasmid rolling circle replication initiator protein Rep